MKRGAKMVDVAQLVEHQIVALVVVGSIPTIHPRLLAQSTLTLRSGALQKENRSLPLVLSVFVLKNVSKDSGY
jgi:hypothetical protein